MSGSVGSTHDLPDLCSGSALFSVIVVTQVVVVIIALTAQPMPPPSQFALVSAYGQALALWCALALCGIRRVLPAWPIAVGAAILLLAAILVAGAGAWAMLTVERSLDLGLTRGSDVASHVLRHALIALVITILVLRYLYMATQWQRQVEASARARIRALQARIRPHFLFNSLNTIAGLTRRDPERAEQSVEDLAELFRAALSNPNSETTLDAELALIQRYLALESIRLGDRLRVAWSIEALPKDASLPALLLQPLVENAVVHGISRLEAGGEIRISGGVEGDSWWVEIENPVARTSTGSRGAGLALRNIRERLDHRYGGRARLQITHDERYLVRLTVPRR